VVPISSCLAGSTDVVDQLARAPAGAAEPDSAPPSDAANTSCLRIRPPTPVPSTVLRSMPCLSANLRTSGRSEEHTSELQSRFDLVCRLLLEKKKKPANYTLFRCDIFL